MTKVAFNKAAIAELEQELEQWDEWFWRVRNYRPIDDSSFNKISQSQDLILEAVVKGQKM